MDAKILAAYEDAPRFDEGELYQSEEYDKFSDEQLRLEEKLLELYGEGILRPLEAYTDALYNIMGMEGMHFFEQGYLAAQK